MIRQVTFGARTLPVCITTPSGAAGATLVLAHGAGSSMSHPSLLALCDALAGEGVTTITFDFPYRVAGARVPDRMPVLVDAYRAVLETVRRGVVAARAIGGRWLGGRGGAHLAAAGAAVAGLVFVGFPLHPPGRPGVARAAHLARVAQPMLFVQGTRDTFARPDLLASVLGSRPTATLHEIADADHGLHVPKRSGRTDADVIAEVASVAARWLAALPR